MADARKRKRLEAECAKPLTSYKLPKGHKVHKILDLVDEGNVRLHCQKDSILITASVLFQAGALFIRIPCESKDDSKTKDSNNQTECQIVVDRETIKSGFNEIAVSGVSYTAISVFDDHLILASYDDQHKELINARITALANDLVLMLEDAGKDLPYGGEVEIVAARFFDRLPSAGKELVLEVEQEKSRMRLTSKSVGLDGNGFISIPQSAQYNDVFGELATKLLKKVIQVFGDRKIKFRFDIRFPINIRGELENGENINFYLEGKVRMEEDDMAEGDEKKKY